MPSFFKNLFLCLRPCNSSLSSNTLHSDHPKELFIPIELIQEILSRIPIKSLLRFQCVCKDWGELITNPYFIEKHLNHSKQRNNGLLLKGNSDLYVLDVGGDNIEKISCPFTFNMLSSCNGLICLNDDSNTLYLWNPSTRRYKQLPNSSYARGRVCSTGIGFYYNPSSKDYEIVRVVRRNGAHSFKSQLEIYSSRKNLWTRIQDIFCRISIFNKGVLLFQGALHWVGTRNVEGHVFSLQPNIIIAFDIVSRAFREIPLPDYEPVNEQWTQNIDCWTNMSVFDERIYLLRYYERGVEVWVMNEYGMKESWFKVFTSKKLSCPIGVTKNGEFILQQNNRRMLCLYDPKDQSLRNLMKKRSREEILQVGTNFVESLIPL